PHHIRVLRLAPGPMEVPLIATLEQISVEFDYTRDSFGWRRPASFGISFAKQKKVPYTAISYCWGDDYFIRPITLSGHAKMITITLDTILRHLRDPSKEITLWADQLCINQDSPLDKERQVQLMGMVYTRSRNTLIWLGAEPGKEAFKALQGLSQATMGRDELLDEELKHLRCPKGEDFETMRSLRRLLRQNWFQRTWIIQEAVLSRELYLMAGWDTISWEDFAGYCMGISGLGIFDDEDGKDDAGDYDGKKTKSGLEVAAEIYSAKSYFSTSFGSASMFSWLVDTRYAGVKEPLDKVYGVMGLCDSDVVVDYSKPKEKLYGEVALIAAGDSDLRMINHNMTSILSCIDHDTDPSTSKLPSWVPDWSKPRITTALAYKTSCLAQYRPGNANGRPVFKVCASDMTLQILAKYQDKITHLSECFSKNPHLSLQDPRTTNSTLLTCINFFQQPHPAKMSNTAYFTSPSFWHSFCSTLVAGKDDIEGKNSCSEAYTEILSFFCDQLSASSPNFPGQTFSARQKRPLQRGGLTFEHFKSGKNGRTFRGLNTALRSALEGRRLCWTEKGYVGLVGGFAREGDGIFTIPRCAVPFVLRRAGKSE
ncbi:hypothetical protein CERZMDRAFT_24930, partial [Cercospora zeae-maydis SCOH1-5]